MLTSLLLYFFDLLALRRSASELPDSTLLLSLLFAMDVLLGSAVSTLFGSQDGLLNALLSDGLLCLGVFGLLTLRSCNARTQRTLIAMLGASALISVFALVLGLMYASLAPTPPQGALAMFFQLLILCLVVWTLAVFAHVLSDAAAWPFSAALIAALALQGAISLSLRFFTQGIAA